MSLTTVQYLKQELSLPGESSSDFVKMWKELTDEDKVELKAAADKEMAEK